MRLYDTSAAYKRNWIICSTLQLNSFLHDKNEEAVKCQPIITTPNSLLMSLRLIYIPFLGHSLMLYAPYTGMVSFPHMPQDNNNTNIIE